MTRRMRTWLVGVGTAVLVVAANGSQGAYFSQSWGWVALAFLVPVTVVLILGTAETPGRLRAAFAVLMVGLGAWIALSAIWSLSPAASIREVERMLVYVAVALALALLLRRGDATGVAGGAFAGVVGIATYALATRLFPDRFESNDDPFTSYRLSDPVGYWNALGLLAAIGLLLGLPALAHSRRLPYRIAAGAAAPVLATALYFTFSRGAWAALGLGFVTVFVLDPRRLKLLFATSMIAPVSVLAVAFASRQDALTTEDPRLADAVAEGRRLAEWLVVLACVSGALAGGAGVVSRRFRPSRRARRVVDVGLAGALLVPLIAGVASLGGPTAAFSEIRDRFEAPYSVRDPSDLNARLFTISHNGRIDSLEVAWDAARGRPAVGVGAGSFEYLWYKSRASRLVIRDAHSLYAEMLAEVGVVGLALISLALLVPLVAAVRARRRRFVAAATGGYVAWIAHSALDWNWEVVGVTTTALVLGGTPLLAAERRRRRRLAEPVRVLLVAGAVLLSALATVSLVGNQALFAGREAVAREEWADAIEHARHADRLLPWSFEPTIVLGDASAGLGDRPAALDAYRDATATDPENWVAWLRLAQVAEGDERQQAYQRVRDLNPRQAELPGERDAMP